MPTSRWGRITNKSGYDNVERRKGTHTMNCGFSIFSIFLTRNNTKPHKKLLFREWKKKFQWLIISRFHSTSFRIVCVWITLSLNAAGKQSERRSGTKRLSCFRWKFIGFTHIHTHSQTFNSKAICTACRMEYIWQWNRIGIWMNVLNWSDGTKVCHKLSNSTV